MSNIEKYNTPIAERVYDIIHKQGLKQCVVAKRAGFSIQEFNDLLNGRRIIKACDIPFIADALNVSPNELYGIGK